MAGKSPKSSFSRAGIGFNVLLQAACVLFLFVAANYIGFNYYKRWDFSRSQKFSLAEQTKQVLRELEQPMKIVLYSSPTDLVLGAMVYGDVYNLLKELEFSGRRFVEVETVDPTRDPGRGREVQDEFNFDGSESALLLTYGKRSKVIPLSELGEFDLSGLQVGDPARLDAFVGESVLTGAFIELLDPEPRKVYFVQGHGEPDHGKIQILLDYLDRQNVKPWGVVLPDARAIPTEADALCMIGPRLDISEKELALLKDYWSNGGRMAILLDPDADTPNLKKLLSSVYITPRNDRVLRLVPSVTQPGLVGIDFNVVGRFLPDPAITKRLGTVTAMLPKPTQSLAIEPSVAARADIQLRPLIQAMDTYWGETGFAKIDAATGVQFDEGVDTRPPIVAASAEKGGTAAEETDVATARMVVVGCATFADDNVVQQSPGNLDFMISAINRLLDSSKRTGVVPKPIVNFALNLTNEQMERIALYTLIVIPGLVALVGIIVAIRRRA